MVPFVLWTGDWIGGGWIEKRTLTSCYLNFCTKEYMWNKLAEIDQSDTLSKRRQDFRGS